MILRWNGRYVAVHPSKGEGVCRDHRNSLEVNSQISADGICLSSDIAPSGVEVPHADRPRGRRVHGPSGGGIGKQDPSKHSSTVEHIREGEEDTGHISQEVRAQDPKPKVGGRQKPSDFIGVHQTSGGFPSRCIGTL